MFQFLIQKLFLNYKTLNYSKIPYCFDVNVRSYQNYRCKTELLTVNLLISYRYPEVKSIEKKAH